MKLIDETVVKLAEAFQLPERIFKIDDLPWVPFDKNHTCYFKPLRFDLSTGTWIYLFKIKSNQVLGKHRHTGGSVIGYNIQGKWRYEGRDWAATPGTFIYEPPGDIHTLTTEDEEVLTLFILGERSNTSMTTMRLPDKMIFSLYYRSIRIFAHKIIYRKIMS